MRRGLALSAMFLLACPSPSYFCQTTWQAEWTQRQEVAKKEGAVAFSIPPSAELRKALEDSIEPSGVSLYAPSDIVGDAEAIPTSK